MSASTAIEVPNIGDFKDVEVIEILVKVGETIKKEQSLLTVESDKATLDIPAPADGIIESLLVKIGDKISQGTLLGHYRSSTGNTASGTNTTTPAATVSTVKSDKQKTSAPSKTNDSDPALHAEVIVIGGGPGGYTAAFRAADLGKQVVLIEKDPMLGGVCLNVGCIPSKTLLHVAQIINETKTMAAHGVEFDAPKIDIKKLVAQKNDVIKKLTDGLIGLTKKRNVEVIYGIAQFDSPHSVSIQTKDGTKNLQFDYAIIAAGSEPVVLPQLPKDPRIIDSTGALALDDIPEKLLVIGGGIIGLEMAMVYDALGSAVTVVELSPGLIPGCDRDLVKPLEKMIRARYAAIYLGTQVTEIKTGKKLNVSFTGKDAPTNAEFDKVLVAVGRRPNGDKISAQNAGIMVSERGFIQTDNQMRSNVPHIFAIGDITGPPMLAHKATHEAKVAAEVIAGHKTYFDARTIPSVAYTDPEIAWMGLTEEEAKQQNIDYEKGAFPWAASGRSLSLGRSEGLTKLLFEKNSGRILGAGIVGPNAGELIAEAVLALEMNATAADIALSIHPHPTLSETLNFAAEIVEGSITDLYFPKK
ncbi:MAG: dihydrolipoyl dehydrogenase [Gammaproteobacteria bacterium]|nr:dihydrolipoyl dehydrogenase [Gammaproteobacteria bacterium]